MDPREDITREMRMFHCQELHNMKTSCNMGVYPKISGLAAWSKNCKWYSSLPLGAVVSLFYVSV
jgi:hypothetical protein